MSSTTLNAMEDEDDNNDEGDATGDAEEEADLDGMNANDWNNVPHLFDVVQQLAHYRTKATRHKESTKKLPAAPPAEPPDLVKLLPKPVMTLDCIDSDMAKACSFRGQPSAPRILSVLYALLVDMLGSASPLALSSASHLDGKDAKQDKNEMTAAPKDMATNRTIMTAHRLAEFLGRPMGFSEPTTKSPATLLATPPATLPDEIWHSGDLACMVSIAMFALVHRVQQSFVCLVTREAVSDPQLCGLACWLDLVMHLGHRRRRASGDKEKKRDKDDEEDEEKEDEGDAKEDDNTGFLFLDDQHRVWITEDARMLTNLARLSDSEDEQAVHIYSLTSPSSSSSSSSSSLSSSSPSFANTSDFVSTLERMILLAGARSRAELEQLWADAKRVEMNMVVAQQYRNMPMAKALPDVADEQRKAQRLTREQATAALDSIYIRRMRAVVREYSNLLDVLDQRARS